MTIWDKIYNAMENTERASAQRFDGITKGIKRKTSGPVWRPVKIAGAGLVVLAIIAGVVSFYALGAALFAVAVILGLAAKA